MLPVSLPFNPNIADNVLAISSMHFCHLHNVLYCRMIVSHANVADPVVYYYID